ncbi:MAG TPA: GDSL-type esterase/lipase family protein [Falsiroseomonas sp.]|nr:GDSL-type esterase/lipase family protein [Falsiroseomonas sp.]
MRHPAAALLLALVLGVVPPGAPAPHAQPASTEPAASEPAASRPAGTCAAPPEAMSAAPLPGVFAAVARGDLRIMVVGSASTTLGGTSSAAATWPRRLQERLSSRLQGVSVRVEVFGGRGTTAADHARIIMREAPRLRPHLVIWQLGTVEAARGLPAEEMSDAVQEAAARLTATRGELTDLVLMDPQFSRFFRANANVEPYLDQLRIAAAASGAQLFSRWALMKHWVDIERLDLERAPRDSRSAVADELHACIAGVLTAFILDGIARDDR